MATLVALMLKEEAWRSLLTKLPYPYSKTWGWISDDRGLFQYGRATFEMSLLQTAWNSFLDDWTFQQDNAPYRMTRSAKAWMENQNIRAMPWPDPSPDLKPIENL